ncbi:MAG: chromosome segregation protein SMC [Rhodospirillaceae bacterium]|nr:chromosome segregation protein SMC [Rhodospirillaceae bacterium]
MQFNGLRLNGFKSFVDGADLEIGEGLTGVVGPNGCGKSNLVEALRWVMGETSAKRMRGGEMDDVIFGGSAARPARNVAEVRLSIDNSDRTAPSMFNDTPELAVTRRIERGKGSNYRVNGRDVRGKDVQLLFADAGTGARSAGIVSQGRIGAIINAKPSERRILLEEAANIRGLHTRRHEADLRLRGAETNLDRLEDVLKALQSQLNGLRHQARQATRYRNLSQQIRKAESILMYNRWQETEEERSAAASSVHDAEAMVGAATSQAAQQSARQADQAAKMPELREAEGRKAAAVQRLTLARVELDNEQDRIVSARAEAEARLRQIGDDVERETALAMEARDSMELLKSECAEIASAREGEVDREAAAASRLADVNRLADELEARVSGLTEVIATTEARRGALERQIRLADERGLRLNQQLERLDQQKQELKDQTVSAEIRTAFETAVIGAEERMESARRAIQVSEEQKAELAGELDMARAELTSIEAEIARLAAEATAVREFLATQETEGFSPVLDQLTVETGYETALGAALGEDLTASLSSIAGAARQWTGNSSDQMRMTLPDGVVPLSDLVEAPDELQSRLSQIGVAADPVKAALLQSALAQGQRLTTRDGGLWRWDGFTISVNALSAAVVHMRQRNRLMEIELTLGEQEKVRAVAASHLQSKLTAYNQASSAEGRAREEQRQSSATLDVARRKRGELEGRLAELDTKLAGIEESRVRIEIDIAEAGGQRQLAEAELSELGSVSAKREENDENRQDLARRRVELGEARSDYDEVVREAQVRCDRLSQISSEQDIWTERNDRAGTRIEKLEERRTAENAELQRLVTRPSQIAAQRGDLDRAIEAAEVERKMAADALAVAEVALGQTELAAREAERSVAQAREGRVRAEAELNQVMQVLSGLRERISERLDCTPDQVLENAEIGQDEELPNIDTTEARLERLTLERDRMGPVNLRAEQEVAELDQQIEAMENERDDLVGAITRLRRAITSLNREGRDRLLVAYENVNKHFQDLFVRLFGGGHAHLTLVEEDDPLDAGLEIMASPPGKKLQLLSLLSGGEQALTATALVFAAFLTNPAPVCVLDEVDAPLDDSNVDRFCNLLEDISRTTGTRFLIITHHRMTMVRMDRLFGVTMAEQGVSQLVSVDLEGAERLKETA